MKWFLGIDIGGTSFKAQAFIESSQEFGELHKFETGSEDPQIVLDAIRDLYDQLKNQYGTDALALGGGFPGIVSAQSVILGSPNLPQWQGLNLVEWSRSTLSLPSAWTNDANCAALGELAQRSNISDLVMLTLGTGVGAGIVVNKKILTGRGFAGEAGHLHVQAEGELCGCGRRGCLETVFSKIGLEREIKSVFKGPQVESAYPNSTVHDLPSLFAAAEQESHPQHESAMKIMDKSMDAFAIGISNILTLLDPEILVLAGGLTNSGEFILKELPKHLSTRVRYPGYSLPPIEISTLGDRAGVIGAVELAQQQVAN